VDPVQGRPPGRLVVEDLQHRPERGRMAQLPDVRQPLAESGIHLGEVQVADSAESDDPDKSIQVNRANHQGQYNMGSSIKVRSSPSRRIGTPGSSRRRAATTAQRHIYTLEFDRSEDLPEQTVGRASVRGPVQERGRTSSVSRFRKYGPAVGASRRSRSAPTRSSPRFGGRRFYEADTTPDKDVHGSRSSSRSAIGTEDRASSGPFGVYSGRVCRTSADQAES
jgi:hypothetical protein